MPAEIIPTSEFTATLISRYKGLQVPTYKLKEWFSTDRQVFFDCENSDKKSCLISVLKKPGFPAFRVYLVVKDPAGDAHNFMDVNFRNLGGKQTLEHFIHRFHQQLEAMARLSLQSAGREYVKCVGHSYEERMP